jgi:hypothetical protein
MHAYNVLGAAASSFTCGSSGVCTGRTSTTQRAFIALQTEINRVGIGYGITKLATDGKIGPATLQSMVNLAKAIQRKLGANTDPIIEQVIFGFGDGAPTSTRDLALSAETITEALQRDGAAMQTWSVIQSIKDMAQQIIATGGAQPTVPATGGGATPINPYPTMPSPPPVSMVSVPPGPPAPALPTPLVISVVPTWVKVVGGIGAVALALGIGFAIARAAR